MTTTQQTPVTVTLTDRAADEVRKFMAEEKVPAETAGLRIGVMPGGCSGTGTRSSSRPTACG